MRASKVQDDAGGRAISSPSGLGRLSKIFLVVLGVVAVGVVAWVLFTAVVSDDGDTAQVTCPDGRTIQVPTQEVLEPTPEKIDAVCAKN